MRSLKNILCLLFITVNLSLASKKKKYKKSIADDDNNDDSTTEKMKFIKELKYLKECKEDSLKSGKKFENEEEESPDVSVIIPILPKDNEEEKDYKQIKTSLRSAQKQIKTKVEIILVDAYSTKKSFRFMHSLRECFNHFIVKPAKMQAPVWRFKTLKMLFY